MRTTFSSEKEYQVYAVDFIPGRPKNFIEADSCDSLEEAMEFCSRTAWEDLEKVIHQAFVIRSQRRIEAVGTFVFAENSIMPVLQRITVTGRTDRRYYEKEYA